MFSEDISYSHFGQQNPAGQVQQVIDYRARVLLDYDGQIHAWMNSTVELECASRVERADSCAIIAIEGDVYIWRPAFCSGLWGVTIPSAIFDDVLRCHIIDQCERIALFNGYRALNKVGSAHVSLGTTRTRSLISD